MYKLTLSLEERKAFDFVGYRYATGDDIAELLVSCIQPDEESEMDFWSDNKDVIFIVPEHIAWKIEQLAAEEDYFWPLFSDSLKAKMQQFVDSIV
jgi:hypothetical protein